MPTYSEEIVRLGNAVDEIKGKVKTVAENKGITIEDGVDTAITVLDKIDAQKSGDYNVESIINEDGTQKLKITAVTRQDGKYLVRVIDPYGNIVKQERLNMGDVFTLPDAPKLNRLTFQEWSSPVTITNNTVTVENQDITIGGVYATTSGKSEFDITLTKTDVLSVSINFSGEIDWGDGTVETTTVSPSTHTYTDYGDYTITVSGLSAIGNGTGIHTLLTSVRLSSNITTIGESAFSGCYKLTSITIPSGILEIKAKTFQYCYTLKALVIPNSVTKISPQGAFYQCFKLTSIAIPSGITSIDNQTFYYCASLDSITIPEGVTSIAVNTFYNCIDLTSITFPDNLVGIGSSAFYGCKGLTSIEIPSSVTSIGSWTFSGCMGLSSIIIKNGVKSIGDSAFRDCVSLTSIIIPESVTSISNNAFYNCYSITEYNFSTSKAVPTLGSSVFDNNTSIYHYKIIVPDALYNEWIVATNWVTYADYIYKVSEVQNDR